jgi:hypothetical protein
MLLRNGATLPSGDDSGIQKWDFLSADSSAEQLQSDWTPFPAGIAVCTWDGDVDLLRSVPRKHGRLW